MSDQMVIFPKFMAHCGECKQCRDAIEAYFAEMPQPTPLCHIGRDILKTGAMRKHKHSISLQPPVGQRLMME